MPQIPLTFPSDPRLKDIHAIFRFLSGFVNKKRENFYVCFLRRIWFISKLHLR